VHRLVYEAIYGPFDDDLKVCHRCDNPPCFRPNHLFLGTQKQNVADMWSKDRGWASLTLAEADVVRSLYVAGTGASVLADTFGVSYDCVIRLLRGYHYGGPNLIEQVMGDRDRAVIEAVRAGAMQKDVAKTFGLSEASVSRIMNLGRNTSVTASPIGR
jgi:transposase